MRVFVTGASGYIGSAVMPDLVAAGHRVLGLARSDMSAGVVSTAGVEVHRGDLNDVESLRAGVAQCDGVIHLGFVHDFNRFDESVRTDRRAIDAMGAALEGSGRPLVIASGIAGVGLGRVVTEDDPYDASMSPRAANAVAALALKDRGVRASVVRLPPTVHGRGDRHGFVPRLIEIARQRQVSAWVGDGANRWTAVQRLDAAVVFRLALENAPAGSIFHAVSDEGVATRSIAEIIGGQLGLRAASVPAAKAGDHFGWLGALFAMDQPASSALTRQRLGWMPRHPGLVEDLKAGHYFDGH